jgi:hypothetical protein
VILTIWFFAITVSVFEISIVWKVKPLYNFIVNSSYGGLTGLAFSIGLSMAVASMFGAAGTIAMAGAVLGTLITATIYRFRLIEMTISIYRALLDIAQATKRAYASARVSIRESVRRIKHGAFTVAHPIQTVKGMNPHTL